MDSRTKPRVLVLHSFPPTPRSGEQQWPLLLTSLPVPPGPLGLGTKQREGEEKLRQSDPVGVRCPRQRDYDDIEAKDKHPFNLGEWLHHSQPDSSRSANIDCREACCYLSISFFFFLL